MLCKNAVEKLSSGFKYIILYMLFMENIISSPPEDIVKVKKKTRVGV